MAAAGGLALTAAHRVVDRVHHYAAVVRPTTQVADARRAVGVVLDRHHLAGDAVLVAPEIDHPVAPLVATPAKAHGDATAAVASAGARLALGERLVGPLGGELAEVVTRLLARPRAR